jgi:hypothetical protein
MKCLTYCVLAFILLIVVHCSNNAQPTNVVEQIKTTPLLKGSTSSQDNLGVPSISTTQNDTLKTDQQPLLNF